MYAHCLEEQKLDEIREEAYKVIIDYPDLSNIDLTKNNAMYNTLTELTKTCNSCKKNCCSGGYNCKYGVFDRKYQICADDLKNGACIKRRTDNCNCIHLTDRKLIPYNEIVKRNEEAESNEQIQAIDTQNFPKIQYNIRFERDRYMGM